MNRRAVRMFLRAGLVVGALLAAAVLSPRDQTVLAAGGNSITTPDSESFVSLSRLSLDLDAAGNPVIAYEDQSSGDLKVLHCNDPNCDAAIDGLESITSPDPSVNVGARPSIVLNGAGEPVVAYYDETLGDLKILHCNDANCSAAVNGPETIESVDTVGDTGLHPWLVLDALQHPVVAYYDVSSIDLVILHCDDSSCAPGGDGITRPEPDPSGVAWPSMELDASGNPVVSYQALNSLRILHCNDPNCDSAVNGGEHIESLDFLWNAPSTSLTLDSIGNPVVAYFHSFPSGDLKVIHCNDPDCDPGVGGAESMELLISGRGVFPSIALDATGNPILIYNNHSEGLLKVMRCGDPNCDGSAGVTEFMPVAFADPVGGSSLRLDAAGRPVVAFGAYYGLGLLHCLDAACDDDFDSDGCRDVVEQETGGGWQSLGGLRNPKNFWDFFDTPDASNLRDKSVSGLDFLRLLARFGSSGSTSIDPLSAPPPAPAYHTAFDRGPSSGPNPWNLTAANGSIAGTDFFAMLSQFGHSCA